MVLADVAPPGVYRDWITGRGIEVESGAEGPGIRVGRLFAEFPGALLQLEAQAS